MRQPLIQKLEGEIAQLRERVSQLRNLLDEAVKPRTPPDGNGPQTKSWGVDSMTPPEIGPHLREVALRCIHIARESADARTTRAFEDISIELVDRASSLEAMFTTDGSI